ncbi:hypothetical protein GCM10023187_13870 [Nibrella viscosa]|uniref:Methyltransferase domain-containing protein n=1 Tax=Nibrella viscosa TaxID=1084524 RepID=A0ABP8K5V6_9BACT
MQEQTQTTLSWEQSLQPEESKYLEFHQVRFSYLLKEVLRLAAMHGHPDTPIHLMDIGPHFQTTLFRRALGPFALINTLGWENAERIVPRGTVDTHYVFDLNDCPYQDRWIDCPQHDIVVMAEVFEHLYTAPDYFLSFIRTLLKPGGFLLIGTPNAVSLSRRLSILKGNNPYERIRTTINNPGHFREYTTEELRTYAQEANFLVKSVTLSDFYKTSVLSGLVKRLVPSLRSCIHIVLQKTNQPDKPLALKIW